MCISNNRRPFPTNGFKSVGGVMASTAVPPQGFPSGPVSLKDALRAVPSSSTVSTKTTKVHAPSKNPHIVVQHKHYVDHSNDNRSDYKEDLPARGGVTVPFPIRLHEMLDAVERDGYAHIISWAPHGRCVIIHKPKEFVEILPTYFKLSKLASFQRQLNLYGFQRLTRGRDRGGYYNELFLRNRVFLAHSIQRQKVKGTGVRARSNPDQEPDFWSMPFVEQSTAAPASAPQQQGSSSSTVVPQIQKMPQHLQDLQSSVSALFGKTSMTFASPAQYALPSPPALVQSKAVVDDDICFGFGNKQFHYLDPLSRPTVVVAEQQQQLPSLPAPTTNVPTFSESEVNEFVDDILGKDMDEFFDNFDFPEESILNETNLEDDDVFGDMLEQMIA